MTTIKFGPWEIWNGMGNGAVAPVGMVQVQCRCKSRARVEDHDDAIRDKWDWSHTNDPGDIIAFRRVIEPPPEVVAAPDLHHELTAALAREAALRNALAGLASWFTEKHRSGIWIIKGGGAGADGAVYSARVALEAKP